MTEVGSYFFRQCTISFQHLRANIQERDIILLNKSFKITVYLVNKNSAWMSWLMKRNKGKLNAVIFGKILTDEQKECLVWDVERGAPDKMQEKA